MQPQSTIQPQQTAFSSANPYAQQPNDFSQFQQQPQQQVTSPMAGTHNPWASINQSQAEPLKPAPTGSNNPFASSFNKPSLTSVASAPTLATLSEQRTATQFNNQSSYNPISNYTAPQQSYQQPPQQFSQHTAQPQKELDPQRARLNALLASGEGMDTFGNTGELRIPAQHTAPGTFVNSAGQNLSRLHAAQTGKQPVLQSAVHRSSAAKPR